MLLYLAAIAWTVGYDTIYALQDIEDDEIAGIKSSARLFGENVRIAVAICYAIAVVLLTAALVLVGPGPAAYIGVGGVRLAFGVAGPADRSPRRAARPAPLPLEPRRRADPVRRVHRSRPPPCGRLKQPYHAFSRANISRSR